MHSIKILQFLFFVSLSFTSLAQSKQLTLEDAVLKQRTTLAPDRLMQLQWIKGTNIFSYVVKVIGKEKVIQCDAATTKLDTVFTIEDFQTAFQTIEIDLPTPQRFPFITWINKDEFRFLYSNTFYVMNIKTKTTQLISRLPNNAEDVVLEVNNLRAAFTLNNNVVVFDTLLGRAKHTEQKQQSDEVRAADKNAYLTSDGGYGMVNGKTVHRSEFGINSGLFWSPNGTRLAYYTMNESAVSDYELMNFESKPGSFEKIKYPMAGGYSHTVKLFVKDFDKKRSFEVQTKANAEQYLTNIGWSPNEDVIYIAVLNRDQNEMKLNQYDGRSGAFIKTLFTETHEKYIEPEHAPFFVKNDAGKFIWMSKRDGFNQLYLYASNGKLIKQLTTAQVDVTEFIGFDATGKNAYYMSATNLGMDRQCFTVELATGKSTLITLVSGVHSVAFSDDGNYWLDTYSNTSTPRKTVLLTKNGDELLVLMNAANPLTLYKPINMKIGTIKAGDKTTTLNYRMFLPANFDSSQKYPVLVYVYGGPHVQLITNSWLGGSDMWLYYMAQQGYVVFTVDNRGSQFRGRDFEQSVFRKLGTNECEDQLAGVKFLTQQPFVDAKRMGVFGWSFGGFMSITMMTRADVFKAGVAGGPVIDWSLYEIMYTERYMDKPDQNPEGYKESDVTNYVKNLKGKMLLIHGTDDDVVLWQHSLTYIKKCVDENVQVDYFVYPEHKHNVLGKDRVHLMQKVTDYFRLYL